MNTYYLGTYISRFVLHSTFPMNIMYYLRVMQYSKKIDLKIIRSYESILSECFVIVMRVVVIAVKKPLACHISIVEIQ